MHELGLTQSIVDAVLETVGRQRVIELWLEIGTLSGVLPDAVRFCFDLVAQGTPLAKSRSNRWSCCAAVVAAMSRS